MISQVLLRGWFSTASMLVPPSDINKSHSDDMQAFATSFGFKSEALSSISDVSLREIVSKTHGMQNGYHKVLKDGGKCLYPGIDDCRKDVGTTVIVRDVFLQPTSSKEGNALQPKEGLAFSERVAAQNRPCAYQYLLQNY